MAEKEDRVVEVVDEMAPGDEAPPGTPEPARTSAEVQQQR